MYHVSAQGVDERMITVHYYYYVHFLEATKLRSVLLFRAVLTVISVCATAVFRSVLLLFFGLCCYFGLCYCRFSVCATVLLFRSVLLLFVGLCYCFKVRSVPTVISVCADCYFGLCWLLFRSVPTVVSVCADCCFGLCRLLFRSVPIAVSVCADCRFGVQRTLSALPRWAYLHERRCYFTTFFVHWPSRSIVLGGKYQWRV